MHRPDVVGPAESVPALSERERLAILAERSARTTPGVAGALVGPAGLHRTQIGSAFLDGVAVVAEPGGRFSVELSLVALPVPLFALADTVRRRVRGAAVSAALGDALGTIDVEFLDVVEPAEAQGHVR